MFAHIHLFFDFFFFDFLHFISDLPYSGFKINACLSQAEITSSNLFSGLRIPSKNIKQDLVEMQSTAFVTVK